MTLETIVSIANGVHIRSHPHVTTVAYDSSPQRMELSHKSTIPAYYSLANVAIHLENICD